MPITPRDAVLRYFGLSRLDNIPSMDPDERREMQQRINAVRKRSWRYASHSRIENSRSWYATRVWEQPTDRVHSPLLSLGHTDKADKPYLIGVFGQGGPSAFAASHYSVVITCRAPDLLHRGEPDRVAWSIVREIKPKGDRGSIPRYIYDRRERGIGIEREIVLGRIHQIK